MERYTVKHVRKMLEKIQSELSELRKEEYKNIKNNTTSYMFGMTFGRMSAYKRANKIINRYIAMCEHKLSNEARHTRD